MKKYFPIVSLIFILIISGCEREIPVYTDKGNDLTFTELKGHIFHDLTFDKSPYVVTDNIYIDSLSTISVEKGVELLFYKNAGLFIKGNFSAKGTKDQMIYFNAYNDSAWNGIKISNSSFTEFKF